MQRSWSSLARGAYDLSEGAASMTNSATKKAGPGLAKVRRAPLLRRRRLELVTVTEGRFREIFEAADVMSEGCARSEGDESVYYGSTHLLLLSASRGGQLPDGDVQALARILHGDPHFRLRAMRLAQGEAAARAGAPLGPLRAEMTMEADARGISVHVEVSATLLRGRAGSRSR
jgi:hypothetical protein